MPIGDNIDEPIPPVGTAGTSYASQLVAFLTEVKSRLETKVALSSLLIGTLDLANNALQNLAYAGLYERASAPTTPVGSLQRYQDNLYWVGGSGAVRITNGAALDASSIGGITGDYGSGPEEFKFVNADQEFYAYDDQGAGNWARIWARSFDVTGAASGTNRVRISWAGSTSYTLELPVAVPAAQSLIQMEADGTLVASNTVTDSVTLASDKYLKLQGTLGVVKHDTWYAGFAPRWLAGSFSLGVTGSPEKAYGQITPGQTVYLAIDGILKKGDRVRSITLGGTTAGTAPTITIIHSQAGVGGSAATMAYTAGSETIPADGFVEMTIDSPFDVESGIVYLKVVCGSANTDIYGGELGYDHP